MSEDSLALRFHDSWGHSPPLTVWYPTWGSSEGKATAVKSRSSNPARILFSPHFMALCLQILQEHNHSTALSGPIHQAMLSLIRQHSAIHWSNHSGFWLWILFIHFCLSLLKHFLIKTIKYAKSSSISYALKIKSASMERAEEALYLVLSGLLRASLPPGTPFQLQRCAGTDIYRVTECFSWCILRGEQSLLSINEKPRPARSWPFA